jgi:hypothetical protein
MRPHLLPSARSNPSLLLTALLAGALGLGCADEPTQPSDQQPMQRAGAVVAQNRIHVVDAIYNTCTGEEIPTTGFIHETFTVTETATGIIHLVAHVNVHAVGTSPTTGETFVVEDVFNATFPDASDLREGNDQIILQLISKGSSPNQLTFRVKYHLTFNANGTITSSFDEVQFCP